LPFPFFTEWGIYEFLNVLFGGGIHLPFLPDLRNLFFFGHIFSLKP